MEFKDWLAVDEARMKGLKRIWDRENPDMPAYARNDLYHSRVAYAMRKNPMPPSELIQKAGFKGSKWGEPEVVNVNPGDFDTKTQDYFINRRFGFREEAQIPNDMARTKFQRQAATYNVLNRGSNEPVIMRKTPQGYQLLEGWHRTMAMLLVGCPENQFNLLRTAGGYYDDFDFSKWKRVPIKAYVTRNPGYEELPGTGEWPNAPKMGQYAVA